MNNSFDSFATCWNCANSLAASADKFEPSVNLMAALKSESSLSGFKWIDVLAGLHAVCQLMIRRKAGRLILPTYSDSDVSVLVAALHEAKMVELLPINLRHQLLTIAVDLMRDWPYRFVALAAKAGISRVHFDGAQRLPQWFEAVVDGPLAKQNRFVRKEDVVAMAAALRQEGMRVTKAEINRRLGWQGQIPSEWLKMALIATLVSFIGGFDTRAAANTLIGSASFRQDFGETVPNICSNFERAHQAAMTSSIY